MVPKNAINPQPEINVGFERIIRSSYSKKALPIAELSSEVDQRVQGELVRAALSQVTQAAFLNSMGISPSFLASRSTISTMVPSAA